MGGRLGEWVGVNGGRFACQAGRALFRRLVLSIVKSPVRVCVCWVGVLDVLGVGCAWMCVCCVHICWDVCGWVCMSWVGALGVCCECGGVCALPRHTCVGGKCGWGRPALGAPDSGCALVLSPCMLRGGRAGGGGQAARQKVLVETGEAKGLRGEVGKGLRPGFGPQQMRAWAGWGCGPHPPREGRPSGEGPGGAEFEDVCALFAQGSPEQQQQFRHRLRERTDRGGSRRSWRGQRGQPWSPGGQPDDRQPTVLGYAGGSAQDPTPPRN